MRCFLITAIASLLTLHTASAQQCPPYRAGQTGSWAKDAVFYQVFVRSFQDSDGDGVGDFRGLTSKLPYIEALGANALWLMPITESPSYHGYDTVDYDSVDREYGTAEDFKHFLDEAHRRNIRVIIDLVVNHASAQHPWFVEASKSTSSPHHDWFLWRKDNPGWKQPWSSNGTWHLAPALNLYYYGLFWGGMPDLNYENPAVRREMIDIARRWMRKGVDGFRLDASRHIIEAGSAEKVAGSPETHAFWREFAAAVRKEFPHALLVGENWTSIAEVAEYFGEAPGGQLDMSFNFDLSGALIAALGSGDARPVHDALCQVATHYPPHALDAIFLTNHDMIRVLTQLGGDRAKAALGASLLLTLPGVPFVYYGEEIGMKNGPGRDDERKRTPMQWTPEGGFTTAERPWHRYLDDLATVNVQTEEADPASLLNHYRALLRLRRARPALLHGGFTPLAVPGAEASRVLAYERTLGSERLLVVANLGDTPVPGVLLQFEATVPVAPSKAIFPEGSKTTLEKLTVGPLPPHSLTVLEIAP